MTDGLPALSRVDVTWMEAPARTASADHWATLRVYLPDGTRFARGAFASRIGEAFTVKLTGTDIQVILRSAKVADDGTYADLIVGALPAVPGGQAAAAS